MTASIKEEQGNLVFSIPKEMMGEASIQRLIEWLRYKELISASKLSENKAWELSESLKTNWWDANKNRINQKLDAA